MYILLTTIAVTVIIILIAYLSNRMALRMIRDKRKAIEYFQQFTNAYVLSDFDMMQSFYFEILELEYLDVNSRVEMIFIMNAQLHVTHMQLKNKKLTTTNNK